MIRSLARSVVSGRMSPKLVRPSSNAHQRELGIPSNEAEPVPAIISLATHVLSVLSVVNRFPFG
jgi:hypothetical protein